MRGALAALLIAGPTAAQDAYPVYPPTGRDRAGQASVPVEAAEQVVAGLSTDTVGITASFDGSDILIYGAVKRTAPPPADAPPLDVIVTVEGPSQPLTVRRKDRIAGIWVNRESLAIGAAPSLYVVATTRPLAAIIDPAVDVSWRISPPLAMSSFAGPVTIADTRPFTEALLRLRTADGNWRVDEGTVALAEDTLFRAEVRLPANLVEGEYKTRMILLRGGQVIDQHRAALDVRKVGLERWLYRMAFDRPLLYGLMSLAVAVAAGWGASAAFRLVKRG